MSAATAVATTTAQRHRQPAGPAPGGKHYAQLPTALLAAVSSRAYRVAGALAARYNRSTGLTFPDVATIAKDLGGCSTRTVRRGLTELKAVGYLVTEPHFDDPHPRSGKRRQTSNRYWFHPEALGTVVPLHSVPAGGATEQGESGPAADTPPACEMDQICQGAPLTGWSHQEPEEVVEPDLPLRPPAFEHAAGDEVEGKGAEDRKHRQDPTGVGPATLALVLDALPAPARADVLAPANAGGRRALERELAQLRAEGWTDDARLVAELTTGLASADAPIGALLHRVRQRLGSGPPPSADELAAADAARKRRDELRAAGAHGRHVAAAGDLGHDEGRRLLEAHYQRDPEALRAALGALEAVLGEHGVAPPLRAVENEPDPRDERIWRGGLAASRAKLSGAGGRP